MPIESYTLDDINIILRAFNLPDHPYTSRKDLKTDIYFRLIKTPYDIDVWQDTLDYVWQVIIKGCRFAPNRKVAFLFEISGDKFAVIVHYKNLFIDSVQQIIKQANWDKEKPGLSEVCHSAFAPQFKKIYESIAVECLIPMNAQHEQFHCLRHLQLPMRAHIVIENSGVTLTESILMLLFSDQLFPVELEQIFKNQRSRCEQQLIAWLADFQKTNQAEYQEIVRLLVIVIKFTLLEAQQVELLKTSDMQDFLINNERLKKHFFTLDLGDVLSVLVHLPLTGILHLLRLRHDPQGLIRQLKRQRSEQERAILTLEQEAVQKVQALSWGQRAAQSIVRVPRYCYERSPINLGVAIVPWLMEKVTPSCIAIRLENILQRTILLMIQFFNFLPNKIRSLGGRQITHQTTLAAFNACLGAGLGLVSMYYSGIFESLFFLSLLFLTECSHDFLSTQRIDLHNASIIPRVSFVPSTATLLRLNMLSSLLLMSLYSDNSDYLKRAMTAMGVSEIIHRLFIKFTKELELTAAEHSYYEFILTQCGMQLGEFMFSTYANVRDQITIRDTAIEEILDLSKHFDGRVEAPSIPLRPWRWFTGDNPFEFFWHDQERRYHAHCEIVSDGVGHVGEVNCQVLNVYTFPPMISNAHRAG